MEDFEQLFNSAVEHIKSKTGKTAVSTDDKLKFYALFKQVTEVAHSKWSAWMSMKGTTKEEAMKLYVRKLSAIDPEFNGNAEPIQKEATTQEEAQGFAPKVVVAASKHVGTQTTGLSSFAASVLTCIGLICAGILGFLLTTLSLQAFAFLCLAFGGFLGILGAIAFQLDSHGLISQFPDLLKHVLLEKSVFECIERGTLTKALKRNIQEILPLFLAQTRQERLEALQNMRPSTRRRLTRKGVVNMFPEWIKRIVLSRQLYDNITQRPPRFDPPFTDVHVLTPAQTEKPLDTSSVFDLKRQARLSRRLFRNLLRNQNFKLILSIVNPQVCKGMAIGLSMFLILQMKGSKNSRAIAATMLRVFSIAGSSFGAIACVLLAFAHRAAKRELALLELEKQIQS